MKMEVKKRKQKDAAESTQNKLSQAEKERLLLRKTESSSTSTNDANPQHIY
jgi:hypothetical protein